MREHLLFRVGLIGACALLFHLALAATTAAVIRFPADVLIAIILGAFGLILLVAAGTSRPPHYFRWLILSAYVGQVIVQSLLWAQTSGLPDLIVADPGLYTDFAGELILRRENPYEWDLGGTYDLYRTRQEDSTPRLNGAPESNYPYPALPFLLTAPLQALKLPGSFTLSLIAHIALLILIFASSPASIQPVVLIPLAAGFDFTVLTRIGNLDIVWTAFITAMVISWRRPTLRAVLFGLAAAFKQGPWLLAPFLLVRLWREEDGEPPLRRTARFAWVSGLTFLIINGPFIIWNPTAWFRGATEPIRDTLVFLSQGGLSALSQFGFVYLPKSYYVMAALSVLVFLLYCYGRHYRILKNVLWVMPGIVMWFSYRSLVSYWLYPAFPMLATVIRPAKPARKTETASPSWKPTIAVAFGMACALFALGAIFSTEPPIQIQLRYPMLVTFGRITHIAAEVANGSSLSLAPRFTIQTPRTALNPLLWHVESGPPTLLPGQTAVYQIYSFRDDRTFFAHEAAQIVVTDAGGDYSLRGVATVQPDRSLLWPDAIPNPAYRFWETGQRAPLFWGLVQDSAGSASASFAQKDGRDALALTLDATRNRTNRAALDTYVVFPSGTFGIWVYPDSPANESATAYGLEIDDGEHVLWILFGAGDYSGPVTENQFVIYRAAPPGEWSYQEIDLPGAYAEAGWPLPALKRAAYRGIDADLPLIHLRLLLAADGAHGLLQSYFGPIEQSNYQTPPQALMAEALNDPAGYYFRLAESHRQDRNDARAVEADRRALEFEVPPP